jgi:hypothetical protein
VEVVQVRLAEGDGMEHGKEGVRGCVQILGVDRGQNHALHVFVLPLGAAAVMPAAVDDDAMATAHQALADLLDSGLRPAVPGRDPSASDHRDAHGV